MEPSAEAVVRAARQAVAAVLAWAVAEQAATERLMRVEEEVRADVMLWTGSGIGAPWRQGRVEGRTAAAWGLQAAAEVQEERIGEEAAGQAAVVEQRAMVQRGQH